MTNQASTDGVESFSFDHTKVVAPFVRLAGTWTLAAGDQLTKYDLRLYTPNRQIMDTDGLHSLEHILAVVIRRHLTDVIDLSPMGCRTGFYLTVVGAPNIPAIQAGLTASLSEVGTFEEVPGASLISCGNAADHNLAKAKRYAIEALQGFSA